MSDKNNTSQQTRPAPLFIGIDLGTSGCRAIAIDASGVIKAQAKFDYPSSSQQTPTSPEIWWSVTQQLLNTILSQIDPQQVKAIAVDGTSSTVLLCADNGEPLTPALMYHDQRAKQQALFLQNVAPQESVVLNPSSSLAKVLWLLENNPPKNNNFHIVHQADWVAGQLCQHFNFSDVNNALKMGFDPIKKVWPSWLRDLFTALNIKPSALPMVFSPGSVVSNINARIARRLGLPVAVQIIAGTTDSTAAFFASGATKTGQAVTSLGSTLVLKVINDKPINDPAHGIYSQPFGEHWLVGGASNSGAAVLRHYFNDEQMLELTKQVNPHTETKLNYYPLLEPGERFPINDPDLAPRLTPKAKNDVLFFQGVLEGIAAIEHSGYKLLEQSGAPYPTEVLTNGGGAINKAWLQIREHKLGVAVMAAQHSAAAYGAALLAARNYH